MAKSSFFLVIWPGHASDMVGPVQDSYDAIGSDNFTIGMDIIAMSVSTGYSNELFATRGSEVR